MKRFVPVQPYEWVGFFSFKIANNVKMYGAFCTNLIKIETITATASF